LPVGAGREAAARVTSGDLSGLLATVPSSLREPLRSVALSAYGNGFASAALVAACVAVAAALLAFCLISGEETAPVAAVAPGKMPCKVIDCRDPL
jgi:hypothetical protein